MSDPVDAKFKVWLKPAISVLSVSVLQQRTVAYECPLFRGVESMPRSLRQTFVSGPLVAADLCGIRYLVA